MDVTFHAVVNMQGSSLTVTDPQGRTCTVTGPRPEPARSMELTADTLSQRLAKTGGTIYRCAGVRAEIDPGLTLSAAAINGLRRDALNLLTALRARRETTPCHRPKRIPHFSGSRTAPELTVQVTTREQITGRLLKMQPSVLYVPLHILADDPSFCQELTRRVNVCAVLPRIVHDGQMQRLKQDLTTVRELGVREALVGNLGLLIPAREAKMRIHGDFGLNIYSSRSLEVAKDFELASATLSFEMTLPQIRDVSKPIPCELIAYGRLPLMVTEHCLVRNRTGECTCHRGMGKLIDKTGAEFHIIKDGNSCRSVLLNGKKLSWLDRQDDLNRLGLWAVRLYFTTESGRDVDRVVNDFMNPTPFDPGSCTRGLYLRGLE